MIKILVPIDFSEASKKALNYALSIGEKTNVSIHMLHVTTAPPRTGTKLIHKMREVAKEEDRDRVDQSTKQFLADKKVPNYLQEETIIRYGEVSKQIINVSLQDDFDLIVMGTKGATRLTEAFIGNNTLSTLKLSVIPTIIVPMSYVPEERDEKACIALRFDKLYGNTCEKLLKRCKVLGCDPELLSVVDRKSEEIQISVKYQMKSYPVHIMENPRPRKAISEFLKENNHGLLALHFNTYSFFKELTYPSVSTEFTFRSNIPILFIR